MPKSRTIPRPIGYESQEGVSKEQANKDHQHVIEVEDWTEPELLNGWTEPATSLRVRYLKDNMGFVHIEGGLIAGTVAANTVLFVLPVGYRPTLRNRFPYVNNTGASLGTMYVEPNGNVVIGSAAAANMFINIIFEANRAQVDFTRL